MRGELRIRELIDTGRIPAEEGQRLIEALHVAESHDRDLREGLAKLGATRRRNRRWALAAALSAVLAMFALAGAALLPALGPSVVGGMPRVDAGPSSQDLDATIEQLERKLRQPGTANDYRALATAYETRYQQSGDDADRSRAAEAAARADRMQRRFAMQGRSGVFGLLFVVITVAFIGLGIVFLYNGLTTRDERVEERWAQVETVLQRRLDLVPQLVESVRGYAEHERATLTAVTDARGRALNALQATQGGAPVGPDAAQAVAGAQEQLSSALAQLLALAEQYPDLKASTNFVTLQSQLEGTENRIAVERQRYNDSVRDFNSRLRVFPSNVVGGMFGYEGREYFESASGAERAVSIDF